LPQQRCIRARSGGIGANAWFQGFDMEPRPLAEFLKGQVGVLDVPAHGQVRAVDLHHDPGRGDRLVLAAHRLRDREQVRFLGRVMVVAEEQRDDPRRGGAEERSGGVRPGQGRFQVVDVGERRGRVADPIGAVQAGVRRRERPGSLNTRFARFGNSAKS
jgi:hypothetical protein